ncbi:efflux RND transporter periplasmic adaptor subunit [uncultured Neptuniibacter sp.]|uniref:efflux RND transporter periplasmic adaptor subunit n=1 Tax=uncultured Neptuniibacter sp. TaxID=502143 RepID=UPI0026180D4D|nr:efflux RND transporter periplasmic adaptor subunit [uncultured Neptuniibacter sp.]
MQKKTLPLLASNLLLAAAVGSAYAGENHPIPTQKNVATEVHSNIGHSGHTEDADHNHAEEAAHKHEEGHDHAEDAEQHHDNEEAEHHHDEDHDHDHDHVEAAEHKHDEDHDHVEEAGHQHEESHEDASAEEHSDNDGHAHGSKDEHGHEEEEGTVHLNAKQQAMIDLKTTKLKPVLLADSRIVPGEVVINRYNSSIVSPQADVRVIQRHVMLGDHVVKGQPLVTLFSDELADRFSDLKNDAKEWEIVRKLGKSLAGKNRYSQAQTNFQQSLTKVSAFGLSNSEIQNQLIQPSKNPLGQFVLKAPHAGVVQQDDFLIGQQISSSDPLFTLVDETTVWVEAQLPPNLPLNLSKGTPISLTVGAEAYQGELLQFAHSLDEVTRTRMARISVNNQEHRLHPGQFAQVVMPLDKHTWQLYLPEAAFTRTPDGDWGVFIEQSPGEYKLEEIEVIRETGEGRVIKGLPLGSTVVTSGTFFLASEQAKAGFDIHNH